MMSNIIYWFFQPERLHGSEQTFGQCGQVRFLFRTVGEAVSGEV
jgi:hypothetical protein